MAGPCAEIFLANGFRSALMTMGITSIRLDRNDLLAISATGSGKSAYIYMLMHVILGVLEDPSLCPSAKFPNDPAILIIYPTTALEEDQVILYNDKKAG